MCVCGANSCSLALHHPSILQVSFKSLERALDANVKVTNELLAFEVNASPETSLVLNDVIGKQYREQVRIRMSMVQISKHMQQSC